MRLWPHHNSIDAPAPDEDAVRWLTLLDGKLLTPSDQARFDAWLAADPRNPRALEDAQTVFDVARRHAAAPEIMDMRRAALAARGDSRIPRWGMVAAAALSAVALGALYGLLPQRHLYVPQAMTTLPLQGERSNPPRSDASPTHYATAIGERATISLPDGSVATLDTQSTLEVVYSETERGIKLLRGQALFEVAKHKSVPFQVYAAGRRITAVGTTFDVRLDGERLRVALIEGKVRVAATPKTGESYAAPQEVTMSPGDLLEVAGAAPMTVRAADTKRSTSWRDGVSVFVDTRLADAVAEMNRYTTTPMNVADAAAADYRLSGVFKTGDAEHFAESVVTVLPVSIAHQVDGSILLRTRDP